MERNGRTAVIGVGNPIMGDDGIGLAALARFAEEWELDPAIDLIDGATWGLNLLPVLEESKAVLFLDAIEFGRAPGSLVIVDRESLPRTLERTKTSPHQLDLRDILALAELRGTMPSRVMAIGLQPAKVEPSAELSPTAADGIDTMVEAAAARLRAWGLGCRRREPTHA